MRTEQDYLLCESRGSFFVMAPLCTLTPKAEAAIVPLEIGDATPYNSIKIWLPPALS